MKIYDATKATAAGEQNLGLEYLHLHYMREFSAEGDANYDRIDPDFVRELGEANSFRSIVCHDIEYNSKLENSIHWTHYDWPEKNHVQESSIDRRIELLDAYRSGAPNTKQGFWGCHPNWKEYSRYWPNEYRWTADSNPDGEPDMLKQWRKQYTIEDKNFSDDAGAEFAAACDILMPSMYCGWDWVMERNQVDEYKATYERSMMMTHQQIDQFHGVDKERIYFICYYPNQRRDLLEWQLKFLKPFGWPVALWSGKYRDYDPEGSRDWIQLPEYEVGVVRGICDDEALGA